LYFFSFVIGIVHWGEEMGVSAVQRRMVVGFYQCLSPLIL